jgi:hypothetical protein
MTLCEAIADQHEIAAIIMQELSGGGWRWPAECNDGYCGQFADRVVHKLGQGRVTSTDEIPIEHEGGRHEWIVVNGRHYDSETPYGVDDPRNLGYFCRHDGRPIPPTPWEPDADWDDNDPYGEYDSDSG